MGRSDHITHWEGRALKVAPSNSASRSQTALKIMLSWTCRIFFTKVFSGGEGRREATGWMDRVYISSVGDFEVGADIARLLYWC